ncbi:MAG: hypothetical protein NUV77_19525 [Thermoguttaceae bacterium]|jgi:hypothetical protein|nr:hypothetical protein [Thermoguttaceae bacterium]
MNQTGKEHARPSGGAVGRGRTTFGRTVVRVRAATFQVAGLADPFCRGRRWLPTAVAIGTVPFCVSYALGLDGHQLVSAIGLTLVAMSLARQGAGVLGPAAIATAFVAHSVLVIAVAWVDPARAGAVLPMSDWYWDKQYTWITTGQDPEYALSAWVPAHFQLLAAAFVLGVASFGAIAFYQGFFEVDLMNFYNAQLLSASASRPLALVLGWHPWSLLRGAGYVLVSFEIVSLALAWISGVPVATRRARLWRWTLGLAFLAADGLVKLVLLEPVRRSLYLNLQ